MLLVGDHGDSSDGRTPSGGLTAESKVGSERASAELDLSRPVRELDAKTVRELDAKTAVAALRALSQDLLRSSAGVV